MDENQQVEITIIGAGLTGLTLALHLSRAGKKIKVIEKADVIGGVIQSHREGGFIFESGPNTGVLSNPEIAELFEYLNGGCKLEVANPDAKFRWIWKKGKWHPLPYNAKSAITNKLFKKRDMLKVIGEPFRKKGTNPHESVADMVKRRLGKSILDYAVDPFISGIYAGDPDRLITKYALSKLYNLEQQYGSFIKGSIKKSKERKASSSERHKKATKEVFSVKGGLSEMMKALGEKIGNENIELNCKNVSVSQKDKAFLINYKNEKDQIVEIKCEKVVSTMGGYAIKDVFSFFNKEEIEPFEKMEYAKVVQVAAGFKKWTGIELKAFGGLIPSKENRKALGILFPSSIFEGRAPKDGALLSIFMGGRRKPEIIEMNDDEIIGIVQQELKETMGLENPKPDMLKIFRYQHAIPQYEVSTGERLDMIQKLEQKYPGLILAGNIRDGIGMADRVKQGVDIAERLKGKV